MATKTKKRKKITPPTRKEIEALKAVRHGGDVLDYGMARTLRGLQKRGLGDLVDIGPREEEYNGREQLPYFGAITTVKGLKAIRASSKAVNNG